MYETYPFCLIKRFRLGVCNCGCGIEIPIFTRSSYDLRRYKYGHQRIGRRHSEESRKMMSIKQRGRIPWNKGKTGYKQKIKRQYTVEGRRKISEAAKRKYKNGYIQYNKGKTGYTSPRKGKKLSEEKKKNLYGRRHTDETKHKLSLARANQVIPMKDTVIEKTIQNGLIERRIQFKKHKRFRIRNFIHPVDIFIEPNICIECDGDYWHSLLVGPEYRNYIPIQRDFIIDMELEKQGMKVIRFWEYDINNNLDWCMKLIISILKQ